MNKSNYKEKTARIWQ